jgi:hypothetical protein
VLDEGAFGAEREPSHRGVQAVGADHEVEAPRGAPIERDVDAAAVLAELGDRVVEDELGVVARGLVQDRYEVRARELDVAAAVHGHSPGPAALAVDELDRGGVGARFAQLRGDAHPVRDARGRPADVDGAAAGAQPGGAFHHGGPEARAGQPVGQRRPATPAPEISTVFSVMCNPIDVC